MRTSRDPANNGITLRTVVCVCVVLCCVHASVHGYRYVRRCEHAHNNTGHDHGYTTLNKLPYPTSPYKGCLPPMSTLQKVAGSVHHRGSADRERTRHALCFTTLKYTIAVQTADLSGISW